MAAKAARSRSQELEELLGNTSPEKLNQPCQDEHLCEIARHITDWPALAPLMGITAPEMEEIRGKWPFSVGGQKMEFLRKWNEKHGKKGTYRKLCKTVWKAGEVTIAEKVCDILCSHESTSESSSDRDEDEQFFDAPEFISSPDPKPQQPNLAGSTSTPATIASPSDPLQPLSNELRITYGSQTPDFIALQWPPPPTLKVFNLALIQSEETVRRRPLDETLLWLTVTGNVDDVMKLKCSIKLEDLFKSCHVRKDRKVILIEGAPGSGKSTLAWDICLKWKAWELFHEDFKVVIYVQLRDLEVQSAQKIADLLPMELETDRRAATSLLKDCRGEGVLFVLDGWDEYMPGLQQGSLFEKLICHPEKVRLQCSTILVTSRPIASGKLQPYATSRVEIVGFTPEEVDQYFKDVFKDTSTVRKLYHHLQERPMIKASCYIPLNAAIVAHLFMELNYTLPTTLHGLFSSLVLSCIIRHLTTELETETDITSLDDLPPDVQDIFQKVCVIAYQGAMSNKVIFSSQDLQSYGLPKNLNSLSLMQVVQCFATGKPKSYHFLHLSIQELLAAQHISRLSPLEQIRIFTELLKQPRFDAVFRYYAAFTKLQTEGIRDVVACLIQSAVITNKMEEKVHLLNLMHCLYEAHDIALCHFVSSQLKGTLDLNQVTLNPFDLLTLKYFLTCVNGGTAGPARGSDVDSRDTVISALNLSICILTPEGINSLSLRNLVKLNLSWNTVSCTCVARILIKNPQLKTIRLATCNLTDDGVEFFAATLRDHHSLEVLDLYNCRGFKHGMHDILHAILNHRCLRDLDISHCTPDVKDVAAVLQVNESLRVLRIEGNVITDGDPVHVTLSNSLKKNKTFERLELRLPTLGWEVKFVWSLRECHLRTVVLDRDIASHTHKVLSQETEKVNKIRRDQGLPSLNIVYNKFSTFLIRALLL